MTGFGSAERAGYRVEIRSLNHRFLDIIIKAPTFFNQFEMNFRNKVKERFSRGRFDITIVISSQNNTDININTDFIGKMYAGFKRIQEELSIPGELDINALTNFHEIFIEIDQKYDIDIINDLFRQALDSLYRMRIQEGESLAAELYRMIDSMKNKNEKVKELSSENFLELKDKFNDKLSLLLESKDIDHNRVLQEAALMASKLDIAEEITRIESHLQQFREVLSDSDSIGRKIDFILQELNREVNTIASKSADYMVSSLTVDMKTIIEKMREQVQNIQ